MANAEGPWKKRVFFGLKVAISLLALWIVFRRVDLVAIRTILEQGRWFWILPAMLAYAASQAMSALRLNVQFRAAGLRIPEPANLRLYWLGMYYNLLLPGGIGGDVYKVAVLRKGGVARTRDLVLITLADRGFGLVALVALALWLASRTGLAQGWPTWIFYMAIPILIVLAWLGVRWMVSFLLPVFRTALGWSLLIQAAQILAVMSLLQLMDQPGPWSGYLFLFLVSSILAALPLSYGGAGAREVAFLYGAALLGLPSAPAVTVSLLFYLLTLALSLGGMVISFRGWADRQPDGAKIDGTA